jgi:ribonuclease P protein component
VLPAAHRLRTPAQFQQITRHGRRVARGSVVVHVLVPSSGSEVDPAVRVGLVVSRAVGGSVVRHRAARRIRAAIRPLLPAMPATTMVVVRARVGADRDPSLADDLRAALTSALGERGSVTT